MKMYLWRYIINCTDNYHSGGGVLVFANSLESAKAKFKKYANKVFSDSWTKNDYCIADDESPDLVLTITGAKLPEPDVYIFQDAGCC